jgi:transposase-like protein
VNHELPPLCVNRNQETDQENRAGLSDILLLSVQANRFPERTGTSFNYLEYPTDVVLLVVLWRLRYKLSLRDLTEMFLERGFEFTHEAVRDWETRFAPLMAEHLRAKRRGQAGCSWYVDEIYINVKGK